MALVALWNFDDAPSSSTAADSEPNGGSSDGTFVGGASTDGSGGVNFDGNDDAVVAPELAGEFDLDTGSIVIDFNMETASPSNVPYNSNAAHTLFSRDSTGFDDGGHLTIFVRADGQVGVRHQDTDSSTWIEGGDVELGEDVTVMYCWSPEGGELFVNGVSVASHTENLTMAGNDEPVVIGATQAQSGDGEADNLQGHFDGTIYGVAIYDEHVDPDTTTICFVAGTLIETANGPRPVEALEAGDLIVTKDNGLQALAWLDVTKVPGVHANAPVRIAKGALGNTRDLWVSPHHRMLISGWRAETMFGSSEVLVAAIDLVNDSTIRQVRRVDEVAYYHLGFENHEIIFAEGAASETFAPTEAGLAMLPEKTRAEVVSLFPHYGSEDVTLARTCLSAAECKSLLAG